MPVLGCLWQGGRSGHTATAEVMVNGKALTLVVIGSDDLGLLGVLLLSQGSYLRKTDRPVGTPGTRWTFPQAQKGAVCGCEKGGLPRAKNTYIGLP